MWERVVRGSFTIAEQLLTYLWVLSHSSTLPISYHPLCSIIMQYIFYTRLLSSLLLFYTFSLTSTRLDWNRSFSGVNALKQKYNRDCLPNSADSRDVPLSIRFYSDSPFVLVPPFSRKGRYVIVSGEMVSFLRPKKVLGTNRKGRNNCCPAKDPRL